MCFSGSALAGLHNVLRKSVILQTHANPLAAARSGLFVEELVVWVGHGLQNRNTYLWSRRGYLDSWLYAAQQ